MSARVFNPMVMSEMRRMLSAYENNPRPNRNTSASPPATAELARVRRNLFGPVDHEDNRRVVERELATQQEIDADRWGFDFARESPRKSGPGTARYDWKKVTPEETVPKAYALGRLPCLQNATVVEEVVRPATATVAVVDVAATAGEEPVPEGELVGEAESVTVAKAAAVKKPAVLQSHIKDYLRVKKRVFSSSAAKSRSGGSGSTAASGTRPKHARTAPS